MKLQPSHALFAALCLIWGATWIAVKLGIAAVPPLFFAGTRFLAAGALLLAILRLRGDRVRIARPDLPRVAAITALMVTLTYALLFWGMRHVGSGLAAVLELSLVPVALLAIGVFLGEEAFGRQRLAAVALGVTGLAVLFGPTIAGAGDGMEPWGGAAIVASATLYSWGSVLARPLLAAYPPPLLAGATMLGGGLALGIGAVLLEPGAMQALSGAWGAAAWAGWAFLVLFGSLCGHTIYLRLIQDWGPSRAGSYAFVSPVIAVLLGAVLLGEEVRASDALGMAVMLTAAWLALRDGPPPAARSRPVRPAVAAQSR